jgi:hypothetical protein
MVFAEVVKKLKLKTMSHLMPYKMTWVNKDTKVIVDK